MRPALALRALLLSGLWWLTARQTGIAPGPSLQVVLVLPLVLTLADTVARIAIRQPLPTLPHATAARPWHLAAWVLFTGLGLIWLTDYAARGYAANAFFGLYQARSLFLAHVALASAAMFAVPILSTAMRVFAALERLPPLRTLALLLGCVGMAALTLVMSAETPEPFNALWQRIAGDTESTRTGLRLLLQPRWLFAIAGAALLAAAATWRLGRADRTPQAPNRLRWLLSVQGSGMLLAILAIPAAALPIRLISNGSSAAGEVARWVFWWIAAWLIYRWVERPHLLSAKAGDYLRQSGWLALAVATLAATMTVLIRDFGQTTAALLALSVPCCVVLAAVVGGLWRRRARASSGAGRAGLQAIQDLAVVAIMIASSCALYLVVEQLGMGHSHVAERLEAIASPFSAERDFLAELRWVGNAGGWFGFDVGSTPWCGWIGSMGGLCRGVPMQIQSDYVFNGLGAMYGYPAAFLLVGAMLFWCFQLARLPDGAAERVYSTRVFRAWLLTWMAISLAMQALVTILGSQGIALMTGIPLPLFSYGSAGLLSAAMLCGLAMNDWEE
jgi:cell division protein FtsW (lipid II flippase)